MLTHSQGPSNWGQLSRPGQQIPWSPIWPWPGRSLLSRQASTSAGHEPIQGSSAAALLGAKRPLVMLALTSMGSAQLYQALPPIPFSWAQLPLLQHTQFRFQHWQRWHRAVSSPVTPGYDTRPKGTHHTAGRQPHMTGSLATASLQGWQREGVESRRAGDRASPGAGGQLELGGAGRLQILDLLLPSIKAVG